MALLQRHQLERIVDVRAFPKSRAHPHVWREAMERWIPQRAGVAYTWVSALGGRRKPHAASPNIALRNASFRAYADYMRTAEFADALGSLLETADRERTAIMCSESLWWRCHRRLIADAATLLNGRSVVHLLHAGRPQPHLPTAGVRVDDGRLVYDVTQAT